MRTTVDTFLNATGRETELQKAITDAEAQLANLNNLVAQYTKNQADFQKYANEYKAHSHDDWKHRNKKDENKFLAECKSGGCRGQGKTGRGDRYDRRYDTWMEGLRGVKTYADKKSQTINVAIPAQNDVIAAARKALKDYRTALNEKISEGHTPESAAESANLEIQAQQDALTQAQIQADATARAIEAEPKQQLVKIAIIAGAAIIALIVLMRFRK